IFVTFDHDFLLVLVALSPALTLMVFLVLGKVTVILPLCLALRLTVRTTLPFTRMATFPVAQRPLSNRPTRIVTLGFEPAVNFLPVTRTLLTVLVLTTLNVPAFAELAASRVSSPANVATTALYLPTSSLR